MSKPRSDGLTEAISALIGQHTFFAVTCFELLTIREDERPDVPTAATDGKNLYVNSAYFKKLTVPERVYVLAHEVCHVIFQHPARAKAYADLEFGPDMKPWQHSRYNKAGDYNINSYLNELGVGRQPLDTLLNAQWGKDDLVDDIYCALPEDDEDDPGEQGWDRHLPATEDGPSPGEIKRAVAMAGAAAQAAGNLPAAMQRLIDEIIDPSIPWEEYLERTIICLYGNDEASWARPNRRKLAMAPHIPWPGRVGNTCGNLAIEVDTSGSITQEVISKFLGIVSGVLTSVMPETIYLMYVDAKLHGDVIEIDDVSALPDAASKAGGGGGTDMTVAFEVIQERQLDIEALIVLTDGYTPFGEDPGYPVIWCVVGTDVVAPYGTTIHCKI